MTSAEIVESEEAGLAHAGPLAAVTLTPAAVEKIKELLSQEAGEELRLRIGVQPGGCSGLRYQLFFDHRSFEGDHVMRFGDVNEPSESDSGFDSGYESGSDD